MVTEDDFEYSTRRHVQHVKAGERSREPAARYAHKRLAELHREQAGKILKARTERPRLGLKLSD